MVPSKISAMTRYGASGPSLLFWFLFGGKSAPSYLGCCSYAVAHLWYLFREIKQPKYEPLGVTTELQAWLILEVPGDDILKQGMRRMLTSRAMPSVSQCLGSELLLMSHSSQPETWPVSIYHAVQERRWTPTKRIVFLGSQNWLNPGSVAGKLCDVGSKWVWLVTWSG